jgi:hypothetical protein
MNPNDTAVLSTSSLAAPSLLSVMIWPHFIVIIIIAAFITLSLLFFVFKRRNQTK